MIFEYKKSTIKVRVFTCIVLAVFLSGCNSKPNGGQVYTLWRNSQFIETLKIHVATFDSKDGLEYNRENCIRIKAVIDADPNFSHQEFFL
jgi:hypothetical protein